MNATSVLTHRAQNPSTRGLRAGPSRVLVTRIVVGLVLAAIGIVGVVRTFDPVALSAAQVGFWLITVLGVAFTELHIRD